MPIVLRILLPEFIKIIGAVAIVLMLVFIGNLIIEDQRKFDCCRSMLFYSNTQLIERGEEYCIEMDVRTGDGKDCFVWYGLKNILFGPLYLLPVVVLFSMIFLAGWKRWVLIGLNGLFTLPGFVFLFS